MVYEIELAIFGAFTGITTPISIYVAKRLIEPVFDIRQLISKISYSLTYYANIYSNPGNSPAHQETSMILRQHASDLTSKLYLVKYPNIPVLAGLIPPKENITAACSELIGISNMLFHPQFSLRIYESSEKIRKLLRI
jgi:hypothetical protein